MKYLHLIIQKSGKAGEESEWAKARVAQCNMLLDRLEGKINLSPIHLHALVFWDEKHKKQILEPMSKYQYRVYRKDILNLPRVLKKILDEKGTVVHGEALRNGQRARRADGKGNMKGNLSTSRRKSTLTSRPVHQDARPALDFILDKEKDVIRLEETIESIEDMIDDCYNEHERNSYVIFLEENFGDIDILANCLR